MRSNLVEDTKHLWAGSGRRPPVVVSAVTAVGETPVSTQVQWGHAERAWDLGFALEVGRLQMAGGV